MPVPPVDRRQRPRAPARKRSASHTLRTPKTTTPATMSTHPRVRCADVNGKPRLSLLHTTNAQARAPKSSAESTAWAASHGSGAPSSAAGAAAGCAVSPDRVRAECTAAARRGGILTNVSRAAGNPQPRRAEQERSAAEHFEAGAGEVALELRAAPELEDGLAQVAVRARVGRQPAEQRDHVAHVEHERRPQRTRAPARWPRAPRARPPGAARAPARRATPGAVAGCGRRTRPSPRRARRPAAAGGSRRRTRAAAPSPPSPARRGAASSMRTLTSTPSTSRPGRRRPVSETPLPVHRSSTVRASAGTPRHIASRQAPSWPSVMRRLSRS